MLCQPAPASLVSCPHLTPDYHLGSTEGAESQAASAQMCGHGRKGAAALGCQCIPQDEHISLPGHGADAGRAIRLGSSLNECKGDVMVGSRDPKANGESGAFNEGARP